MMISTMNSSFIMQRSSLGVYNYNHTKLVSLLPFKFQFHHSLSHAHTKSNSERTLLNLHHQNPKSNSKKMVVQCSLSSSVLEAVKKALIQSSSLTWKSAILSNMVIFVLGLPILLSGLSLSGIASAFLLGTLTWRAFGPSAFLLVATYFIIGTAVTKVKMAQKEAQGVAEKKKGRRGPGSVIGSSAAGCICAFLSIFQVGGPAFSQLWKLGFVASFCTKLSDTVSSEIGKAYGKTTYLVTTFKIVPRGTEGAVSVEGTIAGLLASILLSFVGCVMGEISAPEAIICIIASQVANVGESIIGAALQEKEGFQWSHKVSGSVLQLNNDVVNVINISMGSIIAVLMQQLLLQKWLM
ncbi:protein VTE6, chloroplastic isoform X1 [Quercus suber]|uniref:protein VTE6, chloroplastic isoform X1 n=1 Tax=Quercus suber TaxID=58331 RepID=UPI0032DF170E